jgi:hypothetical protein
MPIAEHTAQRLVLRSGSTTLTLSKEADRATLQRKLLFWDRKPSDVPLADIVEVTVEAAVDRASGVEVCSTMLVMRTGAGWAFPLFGQEGCPSQRRGDPRISGIDLIPQPLNRLY